MDHVRMRVSRGLVVRAGPAGDLFARPPPRRRFDRLFDTTCSFLRLGGSSTSNRTKVSMATPAKRSTKKAAAAMPDNSTPSEVVANTILTTYNDLAPSVRRIMDAGLGEPGRLHAITLFQQSLHAQGDPMRDPVNAIVAGSLVDAETN